MDNEFITVVQQHEREWGNDTYANRPSLQQLLSAKVVVLWRYDKEERLQATVHDDLQEIEAELTKMILRSSVATPKRRVHQIYGKQQRVCIKGVKVQFAMCNDA